MTAQQSLQLVKQGMHREGTDTGILSDPKQLPDAHGGIHHHRPPPSLSRASGEVNYIYAAEATPSLRLCRAYKQSNGWCVDGPPKAYLERHSVTELLQHFLLLHHDHALDCVFNLAVQNLVQVEV